MENKEWMNPENLSKNNYYDHVMFLKHLFPYEYILDKVAGKKLLEIGCGAGYGSKLLSGKAKSVTTFDRDQESLDYAKKHNSSKNINYVQGDIDEGLPFEDNSFDMAISFQVIEHLSPLVLRKYLSEFQRVLMPGSILIITTPNRKTRLRFLQKPVNKYHVQEFSGRGLKSVLKPYFRQVEIMGVRSIPELEKAEIKRTRQSFGKVYLLSPLRRIIIGITSLLGWNSIEKWFASRSAEGKINQKKPSGEFKKYTTRDFRMDKANVDKSLDLMAICTD